MRENCPKDETTTFPQKYTKTLQNNLKTKAFTKNDTKDKKNDHETNTFIQNFTKRLSK